LASGESGGVNVKLETYLLLKTIVGGLGLLFAIVWVCYMVHSDVKYKEEEYKREIKRNRGEK
jgi:hypothetical protein